MSRVAFTSGFCNKHGRHYVAADYDHSGSLIANRPHYREWEEFNFIPLDDGDDIWAIQSNATGKYVGVGPQTHRSLRAERRDITDREKFEVHIIDPQYFGNEGKFAIRSIFHNRWVTAVGTTGFLFPDRTWIREWEEFYFHSGGIIGLTDVSVSNLSESEQYDLLVSLDNPPSEAKHNNRRPKEPEKKLESK